VAVGAFFIIVELLVDGLLHEPLKDLVIRILMFSNRSYQEADNLYGQIFIHYKGLFLAGGFLFLFLCSFYLAVSKVTHYLDDISREIDQILNESKEPVSLDSDLQPIADKLATLKMTLQRREDAALESEQKKNDLVVFLAHDLKTPLTSTIAYLTMLDEQPDMSREEREKYTHIALEKSVRLGELINEFFEITRYNLQNIVLETGTVNLSLMLEQLADESYAVLAEKKMTCSIKADEELMVKGDPDKLARVFDNLLRNAIAYSYPGTNIDIQAYKDMGTVVITFANQGDIIPPKKLASIFDKFYRADNARSSKTGGTGLGLSIAKEIVELHGGTIEATSSRICTKFTVRLPAHEEQEGKKRR
jgi:two-component system sensor histidine kinase VanS